MAHPMAAAAGSYGIMWNNYSFLLYILEYELHSEPKGCYADLKWRFG
jgi:hypothetical protein